MSIILVWFFGKSGGTYQRENTVSAAFNLELHARCLVLVAD